MSKKYVKWTYGLFGHNYQGASLSILYLTDLGNHHTEFEIIRTILTYLINKSKKLKIVMLKMDILTFW